MNPSDFVRKWKGTRLSERSACQQHFLDLCALVGHPTPAEVDKTGESFAFEKGADKHNAGQGWADVWKKGFFYNLRPAWLDLAHRKLDEAVAAAYGWPPDLTDEQILERLLTLNLERSSADPR